MMTEKPMTVEENKRMTVGELRKKLEEFSDDLLVVLFNTTDDVYAEQINRYFGIDGKLEDYVSIDGREWVS